MSVPPGASMNELERIAKALESIAGSLVRLAEPPILVENAPEDMNLKPGGLTYVASNTPMRSKTWNFASKKWE